ncbi:hypothetical protein [Plantibacter sp. M259]|uniref:hypothetical protein n=1 Tax=Plantibacter sp. M259 TaxID=2583822 RepID=UPI001110DBB7|nr:hypothetical protein [Plantibacter sp. M259]
MSGHAFAIGSMVRFHEIVSPLPPADTMAAMLSALQTDGFTVTPEEYSADPWTIRYAVIGDDAASNWSGFALEIVPLLSLFGMRRPFARCAVPVAVRPTEHGSVLHTTTVWGFRGEAGTVGMVAKRTAAATEQVTRVVGGTQNAALSMIDRSVPIDGRRFQRLTGWKRRSRA